MLANPAHAAYVTARMGNARDYVLTKSARFSYWFMAASIVLIGWLHLATPLIVVLFAYLALTKLHFLKHRGKWVPVVLLLFLLAAMSYGLGSLINQTVRALPEIAESAIPLVIQWAEQHHIELPFSDYDSLKSTALEAVKGQAHYLGSFAKVARGASTELIFFIVACVIAVGLFINPRLELDGEKHAVPNNVYSLACEAIAQRFRRLYRSFATVMGAQLVISAVNTALTAGFVLAVQMRYAVVVIGVTFICGLLPIIGNLISNTIIVGIGITMSPRMAIAALVFLVLMHKLEYFLNSKIVGDRIRNPFWLTLLALIVGERLMGIPGMVLGPVILNYIKTEAEEIEAK